MAKTAQQLRLERAKAYFDAVFTPAPRCLCGEKPLAKCGPDDQWGPGCDLGNNEKFVRRGPA